MKNKDAIITCFVLMILGIIIGGIRDYNNNYGMYNTSYFYTYRSIGFIVLMILFNIWKEKLLKAWEFAKKLIAFAIPAFIVLWILGSIFTLVEENWETIIGRVLLILRTVRNYFLKWALLCIAWYWVIKFIASIFAEEIVKRMPPNW